MEENNLDKDGFIVLKRTYSELYKKVNYLTDRPVIVDKIYEYDIRSANTSTLRLSSIVEPGILDMLDSLPKQSREEAIGKMIRKDKSKKIISTIKKGIIKGKEQLFRFNHLQNDNILTIKNDAVFVIGRKLKYTKFGPIEFRVKNQFAVYMNVEKVELYYDKRHDILTVKGVRDDVVNHPDHQAGMVRFLKQVMWYVAMDQIEDLRAYLIKFVHDYKARKLPKEYYREFNANNFYRTILEAAGFEFNLIEISSKDLDMINPIYNYTKFVLPIVRQYM